MFERSIPNEAKPAFCLEPPTSTVNAWCMFRDGKRWGTPEKTKRRLLIGYDLMPLNGLSKCEKMLAKKGIIARRCVVAACNDSTLLAVTHRGDLKIESCCWSTFYDGETTLRQVAGGSFSSACGWVRREIEKQYPDDAKTLGTWWHTLSDYEVDRWTVKDKRRASTVSRLIGECAGVFTRHDYRIVPVSITPK